MQDPDAAYSRAYEDRYRRVYAQGVPYWTGDPDEIEATTANVKAFMDGYRVQAGDTRIVEFGCGEGYVAEFLVRLGCRNYLGIDLSPSALQKARERLRGLAASGLFLLDDITHLDALPDCAFEVGIDVRCLHMLVVDHDRQRYLSQVARLLTRNGKAFFHLNFQEGSFAGAVTSFDDYRNRFKPDLETLEERKAYSQGQFRTIRLPRLPARANNEAGYRRELCQAGLNIEFFKAENGNCIFYAGKSNTCR